MPNVPADHFLSKFGRMDFVAKTSQVKTESSTFKTGPDCYANDGSTALLQGNYV
jgi:hypothetical protein